MRWLFPLCAGLVALDRAGIVVANISGFKPNIYGGGIVGENRDSFQYSLIHKFPCNKRKSGLMVSGLVG